MSRKTIQHLNTNPREAPAVPRAVGRVEDPLAHPQLPDPAQEACPNALRLGIDEPYRIPRPNG